MNVILRCFAAISLLIFSLSAFGDDHRRSQGFLMFNAGTLTVAIQQLQLPTPDAEARSFIDERSLGTLGRADLKTFSKVKDVFPLPLNMDGRCPDGFPFLFVTTVDVTVLTFHDLSQLVGTADESVVCVETPFPPFGAQGVSSEGHWSSGTRRFADVTGGKFHLRSTATPQSQNGLFYTTVGVISGRLERH